MVNLVKNVNGKMITTSKVISEVFGKYHHNVTRDIANLDCSDEFRALNFESSSYVSPQNKELPCYNVTRDGFAFLCMGFTGKKSAEWKEKYINAFNMMEQGLLTIDSQMNKLASQGKDIKAMGAEWSKFGHKIKVQKKKHEKAVNGLVEKVQCKLEF